MRTVSKTLLLAICSYVNSGLSNLVPSGNEDLVCCSMKNLFKIKINKQNIKII